MSTYPNVDESFARLRAAGWSVGEVRILTAEGLAWLVCGSNGENLISARGATHAEAWHRACQQAGTAGMLGRRLLGNRRACAGPR
jgi:hypothetical protein